MTNLSDALLTEAYYPRTRTRKAQAALRPLVLLLVLAGLVYLATLRGSLFQSSQPVTTPPEVERLPLESFVVREQRQAEESRYAERLAQIQEQTRSLLEKAVPPAPYPRDAIAPLLLELRPADRDRINKTLAQRRSELESAYAKTQEEAERQQQLAERQRQLEAQRRREAERRRQLAEQQRAALARAQAERERQMRAREEEARIAAARAREEAERARAETEAAEIEAVEQAGTDTGAEPEAGGEVARAESTEAEGGTAAAVSAAEPAPRADPAEAWIEREITAPVPKAYVTVYLKRRFAGITIGRTYIRQYHRIATPQKPTFISPGTYRIAEKVSGDVRELRLLPRNATDDSGKVSITPNIAGEDHTETSLGLEPAQFEEMWTAVQPGTWVIIQP